MPAPAPPEPIPWLRGKRRTVREHDPEATRWPRSSRFAGTERSSTSKARHRQRWCDGREGRRTTGGQRPQRCGAAADEGKPSKGVNALTGNRLASDLRPDSGPHGSGSVRTTKCLGETQRTPCPVPGCNMLGTRGRRKPSRWRETTRTEHDFAVWQPRTEGRRARARGSGVDGQGIFREVGSPISRGNGGGAHEDESQERKEEIGLARDRPKPAPRRER